MAVTSTSSIKDSAPVAPPAGHLERLRRAEIEAARPWLRPGMRVLELGGGSGYQARLLAALGCAVVSLDLPGARAHPHFPVREYDGRHIPAADASFDLVFSSNVLEHVAALPALLAETHRVLAPGGLSVHLLPSSTWRLWTTLAFGGLVVKTLSGRLRTVPGVIEVTPGSAVRRYGLAAAARVMLLAPLLPHGAYPNAFAELYYFSRARWRRLFRANGFDIITVRGNGLFYTGMALLPDLPLPVRRRLARRLGSACHVFVLRVADRPGEGR